MTIARLGDGLFSWRREGTDRFRARVSRVEDDLVVQSVDEADDTARDAFLDALAAAATSVSRIVDEDGRLLREISVDVVDEPTPLTLTRLEEAIRASWSAETSGRPDEWTSDNPSFQHCDVTSWVLRDYLGGEVVVCGVVLDGKRVDRHAWNRLPSGLELDLTRGQFVGGEQFETPEVVTELVGATADERYELFAQRVKERLRG